MENNSILLRIPTILPVHKTMRFCVTQKEEYTMTLNKYYPIATFSDRITAEQTLEQLKKSGFNHAWLSTVAPSPVNKHSENFHQAGAVNLQEAFESNESHCGTSIGLLLGAVGGCLAGLGLVFIPGVGPLLATGTWEVMLATTAAGAGTGVIGGGLAEAITCKNSSQDCAADQLNTTQPRYQIIVNGTHDDVLRAAALLRQTH